MDRHRLRTDPRQDDRYPARSARPHRLRTQLSPFPTTRSASSKAVRAAEERADGRPRARAGGPDPVTHRRGSTSAGVTPPLQQPGVVVEIDGGLPAGGGMPTVGDTSTCGTAHLAAVPAAPARSPRPVRDDVARYPRPKPSTSAPSPPYRDGDPRRFHRERPGRALNTAASTPSPSVAGVHAPAFVERSRRRTVRSPDGEGVAARTYVTRAGASVAGVHVPAFVERAPLDLVTLIPSVAGGCAQKCAQLSLTVGRAG